METIGETAFVRSGLTSVSIPASVTSIGGYAFYGCAALTSVTIYALSLTIYGLGAFYDNADDRKIYVLSNSVETYKTYAADMGVDDDDILPITLDLAAANIDGNYWTTTILFECGEVQRHCLYGVARSAKPKQVSLCLLGKAKSRPAV